MRYLVGSLLAWGGAILLASLGSMLVSFGIVGLPLPHAIHWNSFLLAGALWIAGSALCEYPLAVWRKMGQWIAGGLCLLSGVEVLIFFAMVDHAQAVSWRCGAGLVLLAIGWVLTSVKTGQTRSSD